MNNINELSENQYASVARDLNTNKSSEHMDTFIDDCVQVSKALRFLSIDMIEKAKSGHPGMPLGMADIAAVLWLKYLNYDQSQIAWPARDRFIVSNGHGSALLYSLLHLAGFNLSLDDLRSFRRLHSKTPGHPEYDIACGIETTTGPLGQGLANAVGMALAEKLLIQQISNLSYDVNLAFKTELATYFSHYTYVFVGDGCLMEGISHEVASFAGIMQLNKLIVLYDNNQISIDGNIANWHNGDAEASRFLSYGWNVIRDINGHDYQAIDQAIALAKKYSIDTLSPTIIIFNTEIGKYSSKAGDSKSHGEPLNKEEIGMMRQLLDWSFQPFEIPQKIYQIFSHYQQITQNSNKHKYTFKERITACKDKAQNDLYNQIIARIEHRLPDNWTSVRDNYINDDLIKTAMIYSEKGRLSTRRASQIILDFLVQKLPHLLGGSADLTGSNCTKSIHATSINYTADRAQNKYNNEHAKSNKNQAQQPLNFLGNYLHYGVREFGMSAIMNGVFLHGGFRPFGGTFLVFSDYAKNAVRMASIMKIGVIFIYSHDSIGLGEDGPTHQPIEQLMHLQTIPNMITWRPANLIETFCAWNSAIAAVNHPTSIVLSRQDTSCMSKEVNQYQAQSINDIMRGGYILYNNYAKYQPKSTCYTIDINNKNQAAASIIGNYTKSKYHTIVIFASGTEVELAHEVYEILNQDGISTSVVSIPSINLFMQQDFDYQHQVLSGCIFDSKDNNANNLISKDGVLHVVIEAGCGLIWHKILNKDAIIIEMHSFGESATAKDLFAHFGFTSKNIYQKIIAKLNQSICN